MAYVYWQLHSTSPAERENTFLPGLINHPPEIDLLGPCLSHGPTTVPKEMGTVIGQTWSHAYSCLVGGGTGPNMWRKEMEKLARPLERKTGLCQLLCQLVLACHLQIGTCLEHLPTTEQQQRGHLPLASVETEPCWPSTPSEGVQGGVTHSVR